MPIDAPAENGTQQATRNLRANLPESHEINPRTKPPSQPDLYFPTPPAHIPHVPNTSPPPTTPCPPHLTGFRFTKDNASLFGQAGAEIRWRTPKPEPPALPQPIAPDTFNAARLLRVRDQLIKLDAMIMKETDPQKLDRLASAQARLSEQERIIAGRPLPGARRPAAEGARRARVETAMLVDEVGPAPVVKVEPVAQVAPSAVASPVIPEPDRLPGDVTP